MSTTIAPYPTLADQLIDHQGVLKKFALVMLGSLLLIASAKIQVPFYPVPITMQTFVVLALGMVLGWKLGALAVLMYLFEGALGLPVFSGTPDRGIGLAYMMGPTGGYLLGFVFAAALTGLLAERGWDRRPVSTFVAMLLGNLIIYTLGLLWLGSVIGWDKPLLQLGLYPFVIGDLFKITLAMIVLPGAWKLLKRD